MFLDQLWVWGKSHIVHHKPQYLLIDQLLCARIEIQMNWILIIIGIDWKYIQWDMIWLYWYIEYDDDDDEWWWWNQWNLKVIFSGSVTATWQVTYYDSFWVQKVCNQKMQIFENNTQFLLLTKNICNICFEFYIA